MRSSISKVERKALDLFKLKLLNKLGNQLVLIKLFGSKARGNAHPESDIDVLIILKEKTRENDDKIIEAEWEVFEATDYSVSLSPISFSKKEFEQYNNLQTNFALNVAEDSLDIYAA